MKETPIETNLEVLIEDGEKEKAKTVLSDVFSSRLTIDFQGKQTDKEKSNFVKRKLPIYFDALQRGYNTISSQLQAKPKSHPVLNGLGIKNYTFTGEEIYWIITPKSEDPFEQAEFNQAIKNLKLQTSGISNIWTEGFLVEQILNEGLRQQDQIFRDFITTTKNITNIEGAMKQTAKHLNEPALYFAEIKKVYTELSRENKNQDTLKDKFVTQYVIPNHPFISRIKNTLDIAHNIEILHSVFKLKGEPIQMNGHKIFEKTIAVILLTEELQANTDIWNPVTSNVKIIAVNKFIKRIKEGATKEKVKISLGLILNETIEHQRKALETLFTAKGIRPEIGIEFFQSILLQVLKELPETILLNADQNNINEEDILFRIRNDYETSDDNELGPLFNEYFIHNNVSIGGFPEGYYPALIPRKQKLYLQTFFQDELLKEKIYLKKNIKHLFKFFRMQYLPVEEKFGNQPSLYHKNVGIPIWKKASQEYLKQVFLEQIDTGNQDLVEVLDEIIFKDSISPYIQEYNLPISNTEYSSRIGIVNGQLINGKLKKDEALEKFIEDTAKYTIARFTTENTRDDENINSIISESIRFIHQNLHPNNLFTPEDITTLEQSIGKEVENMISNLKKKYLPREYEQSKLDFIKKTLVTPSQSS